MAGSAPAQDAVDDGDLDSAVADLLAVLDGQDVHLGTYTDEELYAVAPPGEEPLVPLPVLELATEAARDELLAAAVRSLIARGLLEASDAPGELRALGPLGAVLALRSSPAWVVVLERVAEFDPSRRLVYGTVSAGPADLLLEERITTTGAHDFMLRSPERQASALAEWLDHVPGDSPQSATLQGTAAGDVADAVPDGGRELHRSDLSAVQDRFASLTRVYALRKEADGGHSLIEAAVGDDGSGEQWLVVFGPQDQVSAVTTARFPLEQFLRGVLGFDLSAMSTALAE